MTRRHRFTLVWLGAVTLPLLLGHIAGCAGTDEDPGGVVPDGAPAPDATDGSITLDGDREEDAAVDASDASADADAGPPGPRCTADGWCYTDLPVTDAGSMSLTDVWANADEAWAVTSAGQVLHWKHGVWSIVFEAGVALTGVRGDHEGTVWAVGNAGTILRHAAGAPDAEWSSVPAGTGMDLVAICEGAVDASTPQNLWIAGKQTILLRWTGEVQEHPLWSYIPLGPIDIRSIWCAQENVWAVGLDLTNNGSALYLGANGAFTQLTGLPSTRSSRPFSAVWGSSASDIWMADITKIVHGPGGDPPAWTTHDVGDWHFGSPTDWGFWGMAPNDVWLVGRRGRIYHYDGANLQMSLTSIEGVLMTNNLHGISGASSDDLWVVGDDVALHRKTKN